MAEAAASSLAGKYIVITREALQSAKLAEEFRQRGAIPMLLPLIAFALPEDCVLLDAALAEFEKFEWIIFTSENAVRAVVQRQATVRTAMGGQPSELCVAAVGPSTREAAEQAGFRVDYVAENHSGRGLAEELGARVQGRRVLLPRSNRANPDLPEALRRHGALVTEVVAYQTVRPAETDKEKLDKVFGGPVDAVLFFSPSAVRNFAELGGRGWFAGLPKRAAIAAIGFTTAEGLRELGVGSVLLSGATTSGAMIDSLERYFANTDGKMRAPAEPR